MVFSSITFLLYFFPIFLAVYFAVADRFKNSVILLFSVFFYAWGAPSFVFILLASTFLDFYLVKWMHEAEDSGRKKRLLTLSIVLNLGLLAFFKYANFFVENVNALVSQMGIEPMAWTAIVLPIGISFYTFQTLTYSIDVYRKEHAPLKKVWDYMLYIIMFPQLIAGPIVRFNEIAGQIEARKHTYEDRLLGFYRFCIGLGKKVLIANVLGEQADAIMGGDIQNIDSLTAWIGILAYTFQIYFDFSGYSDMAIGIGRMIGFKFPENFNNPYCSKSITEFWRRWHITLGAWMRNYLYIPLGGNQVASKGRLYFNLWFVFLVSGLWHGASWNFVLWGAFHGFFLIIERLGIGKILKKLGSVTALIYTFFFTVLGWVIFRIEDFSQAMAYYKKLFAFDFQYFSLTGKEEFALFMLIATFFSFFILLPGAQKLQDQVFYKSYTAQGMLGMFAVCMILLGLSIASITTADFNPFIYFRF